MSETPLACVPPGIHDLPAGMLGTVVTYLEMTERPATRPVPATAVGAVLVEANRDPDRYRAAFRRTGERWMWVSRLTLDDAALVRLLDDPAVSTGVVSFEGRDCGILEIDCRTEGEAEITYFGLAPDAIGHGIGRWLMEQALDRAWSRPIRRLWLHTCTLDHPGALAFYRRSGFRATKMSLEILPDPRLAGIHPAELFPDLPPLA